MRTSRRLWRTGILSAAALALGMLGSLKAHAQPGTVAWVQRYGNVAGSEDVPQKIVADAGGNVIVTGYSFGGGRFGDYATVAYSSAGVALWTNRYNGPGNDNDEATAVAVDGSGNVFVTGYSRNGANNFDYDYATLAYSSAG